MISLFEKYQYFLLRKCNYVYIFVTAAYSALVINKAKLNFNSLLDIIIREKHKAMKRSTYDIMGWRTASRVVSTGG